MSVFQDLLENGVKSIQTIRYAELASSVIIVFDHIVTLDQEIELIWKSGWSLGKCLFLLNRYYSLATVLFNNYSEKIFNIFQVYGPDRSALVLFTTHLTDQL
ncbi:hypothetical protein QCA50_004887 [Cerrena zonata]|uniref:DUF6533 domain-containing protein n=1 Tax=Cerrena zonata TaxID=2478898 RepID=A0AAW0GMR2_9APHY